MFLHTIGYLCEVVRMKALNPSRAYLRKLVDPPATILDHLVERFPDVGRDVWIERVAQGTVATTTGERITRETPYKPGLTVTYYREVHDEPEVPFKETIVYRDERIIVAHKPHFLPVVPAGRYVNETLLARLQRSTGLHGLTPVHRLDRETAGLVLFVIDPALRSRYHALFAHGEVEREYLAIAHCPEDITKREWLVENRLAPGEPWFRMKIVEGENNSSTAITLLEQRDHQGYFRLLPRTGKKHQLRVHLASLGFPIVNDHIYPELSPHQSLDYSRPLQLFANRLEFCDPITGRRIIIINY